MQEILRNIEEKKEVRANLIVFRKKIKEAEKRKQGSSFFSKYPQLLPTLLEDEDAKIRKNAALIIGDLELEEYTDALVEQYQKETTLFIKGDYLKALLKLDVAKYQEFFQQRLEELSKMDIPVDNQKHYREEVSMLQKIVLLNSKVSRHEFVGWKERYSVILTTNPLHREITEKQIYTGKSQLVPMGVKVERMNLKECRNIYTYGEILFLLNTLVIPEGEQEAAEALAKSNLLALLEKTHNKGGAFYFRLTVTGKMPLDKRSIFVKKCAFALEQQTKRRLVNTASDYEIEIRLMQRKDKTFLPVVKMYTILDKRFSYRKESLPVSIRPQDAALLAALAAPYVKEKAQVLDPCCGVGTMLMERSRVVVTSSLYGVDIYGDAIKKARENTKEKKNIYFINRDFFSFTHEHLFDEIFTNMPVRGKKSREEQAKFYGDFFKKAQQMLKPDGLLILYSNEQGNVKKQIRLGNWKLEKEFVINEKEEFFLFIIKMRKA